MLVLLIIWIRKILFLKIQRQSMSRISLVNFLKEDIVMVL